MALSQINQDARITYADYLTCDDGQSRELIDGQDYCMTPGVVWTIQVR